MKKKLTGEGMKLVKCEGVGKVFVADNDKVVSVVHLQNESLSLNGNDVLAFSGSLKYDIKFMKNAGILAGGLFNVRVRLGTLLQQEADVSFYSSFFIFLSSRLSKRTNSLLTLLYICCRFLDFGNRNVSVHVPWLSYHHARFGS